MRAERRYESVQPGISTWHSFSAGAHYDPDNVAFGPIVGMDEHTVDPGAGFDWHAHRGVHIVSWVLEGTLRHQDSDGTETIVGPRTLLVQHTGDGIRHRETNASDADPLRFVQITILGDGPRGVELTAPPAVVADVRVTVGPREDYDMGDDENDDDAHLLVRDLGDGTALVLTAPA